MKQSKQAEEMIELMNLLGEVDLSENVYPGPDMRGKASLPDMGPFGKAYASGPGSSDRSTPNDYTREEVVKMLDYAKKFVEKNAKQIESWKYGKQWLNTVGSGMQEFLTLRKGDPGLEYKESDQPGDQHSEKYSGISFKHAAKGGAQQDMKGKSQGDTTNRSKEFEVDITKKKSQDIGFGKSEKGKGTSAYIK